MRTLAKRGKWCRKNIAQTKEGIPIFPTASDAKCFCIMGMSEKATYEYLLPFRRYPVAGSTGLEYANFWSSVSRLDDEICARIMKVNRIKSLPDWNDRSGRKVEQVVAAISKAIKQRKEELE